jgi:CRP-like cAMP-binding protein
MYMSNALRAPPVNRILAALPKEDYRRLLPSLEIVPLIFGEMIYECGDLIRHTYFLNSGIISLLATVANRASLEVGLVGNEGMVGLPVFMGVKSSRDRAVVQGSGVAMRMKAANFRHECNNGRALSRLLRRYSHSRLTQISQGAACNRFHSIASRLARWLLMTRDRMESDEFRLTQEFLSNMLGVRREGVNRAARALQEQNLIRYSRGIITILDRPRLESIACPCYEIIKEEYQPSLAQ